MAGSIKTFNYESDDETIYGVRRDESKSEATSSGTSLFAPFTSGSPSIPTGLRPRYVYAVLSTDANVRRRFEIGRPEVFAAMTNGSQINESVGGLVGGGTYNVTSKTGEKVRLLSGGDTGQTDGDNP